jgi:hypothetical protein
MHTLTIQVYDRRAMKAIKTMEEEKYISIVEHASPEMDSPALPGKPLTLRAFKDWVASGEAAPSVSLKAAQSAWAKQRKKLQHLITK